MSLSIHAGEHILAVERSAAVLLTGRVGIGKTSWLRRLAGLDPLPEGVEIRWAGRPWRKANPSVRLLADVWPPLWLTQTVGEELAFGVAPERSTLQRVRQAWQLSSLSGETSVESLNRLQAVRLALASAELAQPELVLVDNPTASLPPSDARELQHQMVAMARRLGCVMVVACNRWQDWPLDDMVVWEIAEAGQPPVERKIRE